MGDSEVRNRALACHGVHECCMAGKVCSVLLSGVLSSKGLMVAESHQPQICPIRIGVEGRWVLKTL